MEHAVEYVEGIIENIEDWRKINKFRKHKRAMLPCELSGSCRVALTSCGRYTNEFSSVINTPSRFKAENCDIKHKKSNKESSKI